jgi:two-component system sensor histidine kinase BarA
VLQEQVDAAALHNELLQQARSVASAVAAGQLEPVRSHSHQLLGLAALYQMPELETVVAELHQAAVSGSLEHCWRCSHRLTRLIEHRQYT